MAEQLKFDVAQARSAKKSIENEATQIDKLMKEVKACMDSVSPWWKGDAVNQFKAQYDKISGDVAKLIKAINTIGAQLQSQADAQQKEDQAIADQLKSAIK